MLISLFSSLSVSRPVVRACVPKMMLDDVFEQKNDIARSVAEELEKVESYD